MRVNHTDLHGKPARLDKKIERQRHQQGILELRCHWSSKAGGVEKRPVGWSATQLVLAQVEREQNSLVLVSAGHQHTIYCGGRCPLNQCELSIARLLTPTNQHYINAKHSKLVFAGTLAHPTNDRIPSNVWEPQ